MIIAIHGSWPNDVSVISACPIGRYSRSEALKKVRRDAATYVEQFKVDHGLLRVVELVPDEEPARYFQRVPADSKRTRYPESFTLEFESLHIWLSRRFNGDRAVLHKVEAEAHATYRDCHVPARQAMAQTKDNPYTELEYIAGKVNDTLAKGEAVMEQDQKDAVIANLRWIASNPCGPSGPICDPEKVRWAQMLVNKL